MSRPAHLRTTTDLADQQVVVVGSANGIGRAVARGVVAQGGHVVCVDRDRDALSALALELGTDAEPVVLDLTGPGVRAGLERTAEGASGLVVTAGAHVRKLLVDYDDDDFERVMGVNVRGTFEALRVFGPAMARRGGGSIVLTSSMRALSVEPGQGVYAASKAAVIQLARAAAAEFGDRGVRCNAVLPGITHTAMTTQVSDDPDWYEAFATKTALLRWAQPEEIAAVILFLLSPASTYVTGAAWPVDGGWTAIDGRFDPPMRGPGTADEGSGSS